MNPMIKRYGIDTSILVRLATGDPEDGFKRCVQRLTHLVEQDGAEIFASNQVIGEAYIALQHHYGVSKPEARTVLASVLSSGVVSPLNGRPVFEALATGRGCGLLDRLIADDYRRAELITLTLDRRMASLPEVQAL
jgi:predicted nucleic acid-binding protein